MQKLTVKTSESKQVLDITDLINDLVIKSSYEKGLIHLFVAHTTCALTTADLDPGTDKDILKALDAMFPKLDYNHPHDPDHVGDHVLSTIIGPDLTIPVQNASLVLGTWQRIVLIEFDGPKERRISLSFVRDTSKQI